MIEKCLQLDGLCLEELNVKNLRRSVAQTEKGELCLVTDGQKYWYEVNGIACSETTTNNFHKRGLTEEILKKAYE